MQYLTRLDHSQLQVEADRRFGIVDVTDRVAAVVRAEGIDQGALWIYCRHTTCGVMINELEDGLMEDLVGHLGRLVPPGYFAHDDLARRYQNLQGPDEPANGPAHVKQMLFGATSQMVPIVGGALGLGIWQRILFLELDAPRPRDLLITIVA